VKFARLSLAGLPPAALAAGVVLVAINLRPAAASMGPVLHRIESGTGLSSGWAGALATLPVLCFGVLAPLAPVLARRAGVPAAISVAMIALVAGILVRLIPGVGFLFFGTALAGAAIATGNVLMPVLIRRDFPRQTGAVMSLFTTSLIGFAALAAGVTVPLADALGGGWRPGLAVWAIPAAVAALAWLPALWARDVAPRRSVQRERDGDPHPGHTARALLRSRLAWQVTLFFALQSGGFYATLAWLPSIFRSHGASDAHAGLLLSLSMVVGLSTALATPALATRLRDQRLLVIGCCVLTAAGFAGILLAPMSAPYLWVALLGLGENASFPLALMLIVLRGGNVASTEGLSTMAQSLGYVLAALFPLTVGAIHAATGSWTPALILLLVLVLPQLLVGLPAGADRRVSPSAPDERGYAETDVRSERPAAQPGEGSRELGDGPGARDRPPAVLPGHAGAGGRRGGAAEPDQG
jgi:CP family cyanate transporter-like MFS transporter